MNTSPAHRWHSLSTTSKVVVAVVAVLVCGVAIVNIVSGTADRVVTDTDQSHFTYLTMFLLIAGDAVLPILPGETTLNAAATMAAAGTLNLFVIITTGALGAIVGDSTLFWLARKSSRRVQPQVTRAKDNSKVREALEIMDSSAPVLIVAGRYVPGMRFVVNATMGLSDMAYPRFLGWSVLSGVLWSSYTSILAFSIGKALVGYPLASFVISGAVTTIAIVIVFLKLRRRRRDAAVEHSQTSAPDL